MRRTCRCRRTSTATASSRSPACRRRRVAAPGAGRGDRARDPRSPRRSTTSACCASSCSCSPTARWSPTRWRRGRTTRGHYSIDACDVSQFELQVRAHDRPPLVAPRQHSPAVMLNLLGDLWFAGRASARRAGWRDVLALPGAHLHLYGKDEARPRPQDGPPDADRGRHAADARGARRAMPRAGSACPRQVRGDRCHSDRQCCDARRCGDGSTPPRHAACRRRRAASPFPPRPCTASARAPTTTRAVAKIFAAQGPADRAPADRPRRRPRRRRAASPPSSPPVAKRLVEAFWPGPADGDRARAGRASPTPPPPARRRSACAARRIRSPMPCLRGAAEAGVPGIAAPSANRFGRVSADHGRARRPRSSATRCRCSTAAPARSASSRPSSTARAAGRCCCARAC